MMVAAWFQLSRAGLGDARPQTAGPENMCGPRFIRRAVKPAARPAARKARAHAVRVAAAALLVLAPLGCNAFASPAPSSTTRTHVYAGHVAEASQRFAIPEIWIWRVMHVESRGKPRAVSPAGAMGLMQIMPATWRMLSARHGLGADPFEARANILAGAAYLRAMWDRYRDVRLMLAAYNAGPGRVDAYTSGRRGLPAETTAYVAQIVPALGAADALPGATLSAGIRPDWRGAPVFAAQPEVDDRSNLPQFGRAPANQAANQFRVPSALFVPLSGDER